MRIFYTFLFSAVHFLALLTGGPRIRRGVVLLVLTALIPFAAFFVPSINPSWWAITGVVFSWVFLYSSIEILKPPVNWWRIAGVSFGLLLSIAVALGGSKDPQTYLIVIFIATIILEWPRLSSKFKWLLVALTRVVGAVGYLIQSDRLAKVTPIITKVSLTQEF